MMPGSQTVLSQNVPTPMVGLQFKHTLAQPVIIYKKWRSTSNIHRGEIYFDTKSTILQKVHE